MNLNGVELKLKGKRQESLKRADELKYKIRDYLEERKNINSGFDIQKEVSYNKRKLLDNFGSAEKDWHDWKWQMQHRITGPELLSEIIPLTKNETEEIIKVGQHFRWAVSPYYASLIERDNPVCPVRLQAVPGLPELKNDGSNDPMREEFTSPAPCITRRYPDRLIMNVTNRCPVYCRHCQRRRNLGKTDKDKPKKELTAALEYIRSNPEIRDVLITGGDALLLSDTKLDWLLTELDNIKHVEIKRIGTRAPVTLPQRITVELCSILKDHPPIYLNTQFNHPREITPEAARACTMLVEAGVVLGNQSVLLKGINNNPHVIKKLNQELLKIRVRPYYLFQSIGVTGTCHFNTDVTEGLDIMEKLRGYTSGLAIPTYVINVPGGLGKVPVIPNYLLSCDGETNILRTWEGKITRYCVQNSKNKNEHR